jgi:2-oxoglutarate ferredoxin oxidoreductase subunit alpha
MRLNILIGGKAGQGINKISEIVSHVLVKQGYYTFNYRDYPSLIRGGHNFNVLSISDNKIGSFEGVLDGIVAMDDKTIELHKNQLKKDGFIIKCDKFCDMGRNLNVTLAGALIRILGIDKQILIDEVENQFHNEVSNKAAEVGFQTEKNKYELKKLLNKISIMTGSKAIAQGAVNSKIDLYIAYPMTPATNAMHELAGMQNKYGHMVFEAENEIAVVNSALGASFAGARTMVGTSGGGYDLMCEGLSLQGMSEIPLVVYLASRPGPGTGVPTYSTQADLDIALRGGHGEFPRVVIAPGDPVETIEKTNEAFYFAQKFNSLAIVLGDKHLAESEFSSDSFPKKPLPINVIRKIPGEAIVKANSYEHDKFGNTTESAEITRISADARIRKYEALKQECNKFEMIKIHGRKNSKNLIIGWGSTKGAILDAIDGEDFKFLQVLYMKPLSNQIEKEMEKAKKIILVENNLTGQLGRLLREKTGVSIKNRILKYDSRPFTCDELKQQLIQVLGKSSVKQVPGKTKQAFKKTLTKKRKTSVKKKKAPAKKRKSSVKKRGHHKKSSVKKKKQTHKKSSVKKKVHHKKSSAKKKKHHKKKR